MDEQSRKFLMVDDETHVVRGLKATIQDEFQGLVGDLVGDLVEAVRRLRTTRYDLVILDLWFPPPLEVPAELGSKEENRRHLGLQLYRAIGNGKFDNGAQGTPASVPRLILSAVIGDDVYGKGVPREDCFRKPPDVDRILDCLEALGFTRCPDDYR